MASLGEEIKKKKSVSAISQTALSTAKVRLHVFWLVGPEGQRQLKKPPLEQMRCHEAFQFPVRVFS